MYMKETSCGIECEWRRLNYCSVIKRVVMLSLPALKEMSLFDMLKTSALIRLF